MLSQCLRSSKIGLLPAFWQSPLCCRPKRCARSRCNPAKPLSPVSRGQRDGAQQGEAVIDLEGTVGSIIDVRAPGQPPQGHALDRRAAAPAAQGVRGRPGLRRRARRTEPTEYLRRSHARLRPAPYRRQQAMDAGHVGPGRPGRDLQARRQRPAVRALFAQLALRDARTPARRLATSPTTAGTGSSSSPI